MTEVATPRIQELGYLVVDATDVEAWRAFATKVVGLQAVDGEDGALMLKADRRALRLLVRPAAADRLHASGWQVRDENDFLALRDRIAAHGTAILPATDAEIAARRVTGLFAFEDPAGNRAEVFWGPISDFRRFNSPVGVPHFVTGDLGLGHVVVPAMNFDATQHFWTEVMGFGLSDILHSKRPQGHNARIHFMHCNGRQHSLALAEIPAPTGCVHMMLELPNLDEVGLALDRVEETATPIMMTLGRHVNDEMVSFYVQTPGGFGLELGCDGLVKDWASENKVFETTRGSHWGHKRPAPRNG